MATTQVAEATPEPTADVTADPVAHNVTSDDETAVPRAPNLEPANEAAPTVASTFACVHPTISLHTATDKLNGSAPIIDAQTEIVVRYADGNVSRVSVAHTQHAEGTNTARIADALSKVTADSVVRCLAS
ncbi:hypothetical protein ABEG10_21535 [Burkholderia cenocepacia]|uniref:hypothetical protein n=1 Tax=Burkholderia cenocepacia TaxID=95486 RepID=UPI0020A23340|nr:hypothetical protein [Burkholderia cenocepacia]MCO8320792.1 hypothetical protein [Burkholderia cenocepacia]MCO8328076.1 hypothetical protein [Burkholderia cenocepacia]MCO8335363.1 hypothetical protein [Burkholderia cenocepacia]MCO8342647.1 hypothetical protein [Burkholderia cenocepacia]MCO8355929.1 hypothetical protein [Burkholderia cenocepacia]